jgi:hypothetical protein
MVRFFSLAEVAPEELAPTVASRNLVPRFMVGAALLVVTSPLAVMCPEAVV